MTWDAQDQLLIAERRCQSYQEMIAAGQDWCRVPYEIARQWIELLRRERFSAAEAAALVQRCDECKGADLDPSFFAMSDAIRHWYRAAYEAELSETFRKTIT